MLSRLDLRCLLSRGNQLTAWPLVKPLSLSLEKEVALGHLIYGQSVRALARRIDCDDVLFVLASGQVACVHLIWSGQQESPPWPSTHVYGSLQEFIATRMQDDAALY